MRGGRELGVDAAPRGKQVLGDMLEGSDIKQKRPLEVTSRNRKARMLSDKVSGMIIVSHPLVK